MSQGIRQAIKSLFCSAALLFLSAVLAAQPAPNAVALFEQGKAAGGEEDYYLAIEKYKAALSLNPHYLDPMKGLAECFFFIDEYEESLRWVTLGRKYNQHDLSLLTLEGRINVIMGNLEKAGGLFTLALRREPNNIEAMTGIALLDIASGRIRFAAKQFEDALVLNPQHRVTLLSLALIHENLGDPANANRYIELALKNHPDYFLSHYVAGRAYYLQGDWNKSESRLKTALALRGDYEPARMLLGNLYAVLRQYDQAVETLRPLLSQNPGHALARYVLGLAYWGKRDISDAVQSFESAIGLAPNDEWSRLALEHLAVTELAEGNEERVKLARHRLEQGKLWEGKNLLEPALLEYRRAIKLDPVTKDGRLAFAGIYKKRGFPLKYLNELQILKDLGLADRRIEDDIAYYKTKSVGGVADRWQIDQHDLDLRGLSVQVFTSEPRHALLHPAAAEIVTRLFRDVLDGYGKLRVLEADPGVGGYEEAFRIARGNKVDYFILLNFKEAERTFSARTRLYLARTGALLADFSTERSGNDRVRDALLKSGGAVNTLLPVRGVLLKKEFDRGVIDLGTFHGLKEKDTLLIVKAGKVSLKSGAIGYGFQESDVVGEITLEQVDEAVAEGGLKKKSFYDYVTTGDETLFLPQAQDNKDTGDKQPASSTPSPASELLRELVGLK